MAFNALPLRPAGAGISTYIRELLAALVPLVAEPMTAVVSEDAVVELPEGITPLLRPPASGLRRAWQGFRPPGVAKVVHGLDVDLPTGSKAALVSTVHDLSVFDVPWAFPAHRVAAERILVSQAVRRADVVIAVSAFTAERIKKLLNRDAVVIPEAPSSVMVPPDRVEMDRVRARYGLPRRFVLHVGTFEPRKNLAALARACDRAEVTLVAVGRSGWGKSPAPGVVTLEGIPGTDLPGLYGAATLTAYASVYEGFGLPPVEAMACGCPVVSTSVPALAYVGDAARVAASPREEDLAEAISELLHDEDQRLERVAVGLRATKSLTWADNAAATAGIYERLGVALKVPGLVDEILDPGYYRGGPTRLREELRAGLRAITARPLVGKPQRSTP